MEDKIYCGNAKEIQTQYGPMMKVTLDLEHIFQASKDGYSFTTSQGRKKIKIDITSRREPDQYGNTHSVSVDTWKPDGQHSGNQPQGQYTQQQGNALAPEFQNNPQNNQQNRQQQNGEGFKSYTPPTGTVNNQYDDDVPF